MTVDNRKTTDVQNTELATPIPHSELNSSAENKQVPYRSKAFTTKVSINPLVAAASPIFSVVEKLKRTEQVTDIKQLQQDLHHEIRVFEDKVRADGYSPQTVFAGCYVLCAWIDEMILATSWGTNKGWKKNTL